LIRTSGTAEAPSLTRLELLRRVLRRPDVDLLDRLEQRHHLRVYEFGAAVREVDPGSLHRRGAEAGEERFDAEGVSDGGRAPGEKSIGKSDSSSSASSAPRAKRGVNEPPLQAALVAS